MFQFDRAQRSTVVICIQCHARTIRLTRAAADAWALEHLEAAHPGISPAQERYMDAARHRARYRRDTPSRT